MLLFHKVNSKTNSIKKLREMISLIIPQSGRTFENFMHKIKDDVLENENISHH